MDNDTRIPILKNLIEIDKHTDIIKEDMREINRKIAEIAQQMQIIGSLYVNVLIEIRGKDE